MQLKLTRTDRRLLLGASIVFALLVGGAVFFAGGQGSKAEVPTTYSSGSAGAKAAYLLLRESGYNVVRWERPLDELPDPAGKILVLTDPQEAPTNQERSHLRSFISEGGHVVATGMFAETFLPRSSIGPDFLRGMTWETLQPLAPSGITRAAPEITMAPEAYWDSTSVALPLYGDHDHTRVVKYNIGKGEVIWWASATPLTNAGLKASNNLEFLLACLGDGTNENRKEILWDEYIHGYRQTIAASTFHSPVMWIFLQLGLLALAVLVTFSRRSGPIFAPVAPSRLSPLEFVQTLGGLYGQANASSVAVEVSYQRFRYWLTRRLGLANNASAEDLQTAVRERLNFSAENFATTLTQCDMARYNPSLPPKEALHLVQTLDDYATQLKLFRVSRKEKA